MPNIKHNKESRNSTTPTRPWKEKHATVGKRNVHWMENV